MKYVGENALKKWTSLVKSDIKKKLDKNQGTANSGKILGVDASGEVALTDTEVATLVDVPNGIVKGDGNTLSAAVAGTDYMAPVTGGTTGQVLTKTADGQEWKDREKSTFIVTISGVYGQTFTADKTFLEIQEAYDAGKVCFALYTEIVLPLIAFDREIGVGFGQKMDRGLFYSFLIGTDDTITLNVYEAQNKITASGLLKGDGKGGVSAAVAGTDYVTPDGMNSAVAEAKPFIVTFTYNGDYHADKTFEEIKAAYDAGKMCYANFLGNICLRGVFSNSYVTFIAFNVQGSSESIATSMGFIRIYSDNSIVVNGIQNQPFITASGLLKGDGNGGVSAATAGTDYMVPPTGGTAGQVLTKTANSSEWADAPKSLPEGGTAGDALVKSTDGGSWETPVEASLVEIMTKSEVEAAIAASSAKITASTTDLTAGTSPLATGELYVVYE